MQVTASDVNSILFEAGSYDANVNLTLVESNDANTKFYARNIVLSNVGVEKSTVTLKLRNNIIINKILEPGEYFNYISQIIVTQDNPLRVLCSNNSIDISVLFIEKIVLTSD